MKTKSVQNLVQGALIAALYAVLTLTVAPLSFDFGIQLRLSEALCVLPLLTPVAIPGLTVGCILSNAIGVAMGLSILPDILFGSCATLIAALLTYLMRNMTVKKLPLLPLLPPVIVNAIVVGVEFSLFMPGESAFFISTLMVGLSEACVVYVLGIPLYFVLRRLNIFKSE